MIRLLFSEGFRIFFLSACGFALAALGLWEGWLALQVVGVLVDYRGCPGVRGTGRHTGARRRDAECLATADGCRLIADCRCWVHLNGN